MIIFLLKIIESLKSPPLPMVLYIQLYNTIGRANCQVVLLQISASGFKMITNESPDLSCSSLFFTCNMLYG